MTLQKTITFSAWGSMMSLCLAFCSFPLMRFGTGKLAHALWGIALRGAGSFALVLLGCALGLMGRAFWKNTSMDASLYPWLVLVFLFVAWAALFSFLSKMP